MIHEILAIAFLAVALFVRNNRVQASAGSIGTTFHYGRLISVGLVVVAEVLLVLGATPDCAAAINGLAITALIFLSSNR